MKNSDSKVVRVAVAQVESKNGLVEVNLKHATTFVERAAREGAKLILLPELMPAGYIFTPAMWEGAEPSDGMTVQWLKENSRRFEIWLGTSFLEADGEDFFNTFVLATPDGNEAGRVRKQTPACFEAYFTKGGKGPHVIETELGKIGVGICYENQLSYIPRIMFEHSADLLLMPHSYPAIGQMFFRLRGLAEQYARLLGIPSLVSNKYGEWHSPYPGIPFYVADSRFPGLSTIADSDGSVKAQLGDEENVIVADVLLEPGRKITKAPKCHGRWAWEGPWLRNSCLVIEAIGQLWYALSLERKRKARLISSTSKY
jgi:N-carbamoylputrescine amidase